MCLGIPMRILEGDDITALCEAGGERRRVSLLLIGEQKPGTLVLVHIDTAIRVLDEAEAVQIEAALAALAAVERGEAVEEYFADLVGREPELPAFLRG
jgi:hydrogenase expression/formation protein HypC